MSDNYQPIWARESTVQRPPIDDPLYNQPLAEKDGVQSWDQAWQQRTNSPRGPHRRPSLLQRLTKLALMLGATFLFLTITGGVAFAAVGRPMLDDWYLSQEPFDQEVWCNRTEKYLRTSHFCDLRDEAARPDNPFVPTLVPDTDGIRPEDLLLTPFFDSEASVVVDDPVETPVPVTQVAAVQTALPTMAPTATFLPTNTPEPTIAPLPASARLDLARITPEAQGWNNCGPTTLTMGLTYYGYQDNQYPAAGFLKPNREDKNVSPWQMVRYANERVNTTSVRALYRVGGTFDLLKRLLAAGYPVIIEKGYEPEGYDWMGHYLLLVGYDDTQAVFYTFDSFLGTNGGQGRRETYEYTATYWQHFNNTFIVLYDPSQESQLYTLLGDHADEMGAVQLALENAHVQANANPNDKWAWFNMGDAYARLGQYQEAASAFDRAFNLQMPWRTLWYLFTPFETYYNLGRYSDVIQLADSLDRSSQNYVEEAWYYRGLAYAAQGRNADALTQFERVLNFNPNFTPATQALAQVQNGVFVAPVS